MINISQEQLFLVVGGTAPSCSTSTVNGQTMTVCSCPAGTTASTTVRDGSVKITCEKKQELMKILDFNELNMVVGGNTAPTCTTTNNTTTCSCPAGTVSSTTVVKGTATLVCVKKNQWS